jgi:hypothetical protein
MSESALRTVVWQSYDGLSVEHAVIVRTPAGYTVRSTLIAAHGSEPARAVYRLAVDTRWRLRRLRASWSGALGTARLLLERDTGGMWRENGRARADLIRCSDVDIAWTPLTNTLPIRRLGLAVGEQRDLTVAYVAPPSLQAEPDGQRYTRLDLRQWRYESLDSAFTATVTVDDDGLVLDYPPLFRRVATWPPRTRAL